MEVQQYGTSNDAIEIRNEITFDFYTGLPQVYLFLVCFML